MQRHHQRATVILVLRLLLSSALALGLAADAGTATKFNPPSPIRPPLVSQASVLVANGIATDDVAHGPTWTATSGVGYFAIDAARRRVRASIPFQTLLLLEDAAYVHLEQTPAALGPKCRKYLGGAVRTGSDVPGIHPLLSFLDQYFCQWIQPSPCSQGRNTIDVFWTSFNITVETKLPFASSFPKTLELHYDVDGVLTHLSHWTSNQKSPPFSQVADISHSDDNVWNITRDISDPLLWVPDPTWNCTIVPQR